MIWRKLPRRPNDLDYIKYVSSEQIVNTIQTTKLVDQKALSMMPSGMVHNYMFKGSGGYQFQDMSGTWLPEEATCSTATALGDLDNDGDLDIIVNNVDSKPMIYINHTDVSANYLKIKLKYDGANPFGIGTKVYSYHGGVLQFKELYTVRGFQASSEPMVHFGYGQAAEADSIKIIWPDGKAQKITKVKTNQTLVLSPGELTEGVKWPIQAAMHSLFQQMDQKELGLAFD